MAHEITLLPFGITFACEEDESILDASIRQGIQLRYGCKHGGCGSCKAQIADGEVDVEEASTFALMDYERAQGLALLCSAYPLSDISIALADDYEEADLHGGIPVGDFRAQVRDVTELTHDITHLALTVTDPSPMEFRAGQYVEINVPGSDEWRAFSMANAPSDAGQLDLVLKILPDGLFSQHVASAIRSGDQLDLRGPFGQFVLTEGTAPIVMVAGGSGMAPIWAMLEQLVAEGSKRPVTFFYGARSVRDLFWTRKIEALGAELPEFTYVPAISDPRPEDEWSGEVGLVTEVVDRRCESLRGSEAYLCGPPAMIDAAIDVLRGKGLFSTRIRFDKFVSSES